jgi:hypothetical protein
MRQNRAYFIAGFSSRKGSFAVAAYLHETEEHDVEFTRFYMSREDSWVNQEFNEDIVSVSYTKSGDDWSWWLLSKQGKVISASPRGRIEEIISDAGTGQDKFGYLSQLKCIDGTLYAVGVGRQIYHRINSQWTRMDEGIRTASVGTGLRAIDGLGRSTLHAVGYGGEIWYFDGKSWQMAPSPTNMTLEAIRVISPNLCYACGKSGVVLRGFGDSWEAIENKTSGNLWAVEYFKDRAYLAGTKGLFTLEGDQVEPLALGRKAEGRRLYTNGDELWSMEHHELWVFNGTEWKERVCPDNA